VPLHVQNSTLNGITNAVFFTSKIAPFSTFFVKLAFSRFFFYFCGSVSKKHLLTNIIFMKKFILFLIALVFALNSWAQQRIIVGQNYTNPNEVTLVAERGVATTIKFDLNELNLMDVRTNYGDATAIFSGKAPLMLDEGNPELFYLPTAIIIPDVGAAELEITYGEYTDIENIELVPSKGNLPRSIDPTTVPYVKGEVYNQNAFFPGTLATINETFIMRDVRGISIFAYPVQYNPVTKTLRIYSEMTVTVNYNDNEGVNEFTNQKRNATIDPTFADMYRNLFLNYTFVNRGYPTEEVGELLIICHTPWVDEMKPYIDWKRTIGRKTTIVSTAQTGTTPAGIKSYIQNFYNAPENNLAYVLLVGDAPQIPPHGTSSVPSDVEYGRLTTGSNYMDVLIGRMSAENIAHVQTQIQRAIHYERDLTTADTWISTAMGVARNEGTGGGHDGGENDYVHMNNIRNRLLNYGYEPVYQDYDGNCPGVPNTTVAQISQRINNGVSMINFCNHGSEDGWSVAYYSNSHVNQLQNVGKLPFIYSVACVNGRFMWSDGPCFAETWMRATHNGQPTGAVATFMATINISWMPTMTSQDEFVNIVMDLPSPYSGQQPGIKRTFAGACYNATQKMIMVHGSSGMNDYLSWLVFGDPTLMIRTKTPQAMTVSHTPVIFFGMSDFSVNCDAEGAAVTMSYIDNDEVIILASATVSGGIANLSFEPITMPVEITVCITGRDKVTYIGEVLATPSDGPYVVPAGYTVVGAETLTYISTNTEIEVTLKNVGVDPANGPINVTLTCNDPQLTVTQATAQTTTIAPDGTATVKFKVTVANDIPDGKTFLTDVTIVGSGKTTWEGKLPLKAFAPVFSLEKVLINDVEDGNLPKGNLVKLTTVVKNMGGAGAYNVVGEINLDGEYINFACEELNPDPQHLSAGETMDIDFFVITHPDMPGGYVANLQLLLTAMYERSQSEPFTAISTGAANYCTPGTTNCSQGDRFTLVRIVKTSDQSVLLNNTDPACGTNGYTNNSDVELDFIPGEQYTITVTVGYQNQNVRGWIDLNGNGVFDANEKLISFSCPVVGTQYSQNFTIPQDIASGSQRLRLRAIWNSSSTDPNACDQYGYGQTLDYTAVLPNLYPHVQNVNAELNEETGIITITWQAPEEGTPMGYNIRRAGELLNETLLTDLTFTEENVTEGVYVYNVTAVYEGDKESLAKISNVICNYVIPPLPCETPVNVSGDVDEANCVVAVIRWDALEGIEGVTLLNYNIYRDNVKIAEALSSDLEYRDELSANGTYVYQVSAVYEHCEESEWTSEIAVEISCVNINEIQADAFQIFPNPANNSVIIKGDGLVRVEFYDLQGRKLAEYNNIKDHLQINDLSKFESGVYFVRMYSENNEMATKRLVIVK